MTRVLLLGGTTEASQMARALSATKVEAVFSYAGRTDAPVPQPLPTRIGGFGGVAGLVDYLRREGITHIIDATHPFAAQMSRNAQAASGQTGVPLITFQRPGWVAGEGDFWHHVSDIVAAVDALPKAPARVFLAIGKQNLAAFAAKPQHHYLLRLVDPPETALPLPNVSIIIARGPFNVVEDTGLLREHKITHLVAKNAGGSGAEAKLIAARALGLPVIMIDRPDQGRTKVLETVEQVMTWLGHTGTERGV